jgi:Carboxypeptidase regulatory-like domain
MKRQLSSFVILALGIFCALVTMPVAKADNLYASIRGTVVDPSGAVVPGAQLTATNVATGLSYNTTSDTNGAFSFLQLQIGDYSVRAERTGFKTYTAGHIHLDLDQIFSLRVAMELGTTSETITVEANPAQVETTSMQLGTTVTGSQIVQLPMNGRNWTQLMQLQPGVQAGSDRFGTSGNGGGYSTNGAETQQNSFLINGTDSNDTELNTPLVIPSPDAIGEFNLVSSTINPEYGRNSGAIVNAAIKNGTNQFHGDVFDFYRDTFLDAIPWFQTTRALFHQNQFGGTVGGPIVKDHAFFFFSYQARRATTPQPSAFPDSFNGINLGQPTPTVYSQAERGGDFSADTGGAPFTCTGTCVSPFPMVGSNGVTQPAGTPYATLFPTGVIPMADLNPLSVKLLNQYVPLPNAANDSYQFNPLERAKRNQYLGRIDEKISNKDAVWFYGLYENDATNDDLAFVGSNLPRFGSTDPAKYYEYTAAWNHTFSPTMLNEARFAYLRFNYGAVTPLTTQSASGYGFSGISSTQAPAFSQLPVVSVTGLFSLGFSADGPQPRVQNTYQAVDNLSKVWGHHTLKFGFNMDRLEINNPFYSNLNGTYSFGGQGPFSTGSPAADFLLGIPDSYTQGSGSVIRARGREYYSYGQDQWQVRPNLTLTMGLAWDIETPYKNLYADGEVLSAFHPGQQSTIFPTAPVGIVFPGDKGVGPYGDARVHYHDFAPRLGFAWSPGSSRNWSVRGGIGLYYNRSESEATLQTLTNAPFSVSTAGSGVFGTSPAFANPYNSVNTVPIGTFPSVCPAGCVNTSNASPFPFTPPTPGTSPSFAPFEPIGFDEVIYDPHLTVPRSTNYNLTVEYQVSKSTVLTVGYVGNVARHLEGAYNLNPAGQAPGVNPTAVGLGCTSDFFLGLCTGGAGFQYNPNVYGQIGVFATAWSSNYNSLQASINRHFSNGLQFQAAYTWSRYFDYTSNLENSAFNGPGFNDFNNAQNYGPSANDAPQRLVMNFVYTLPIYKYGHHWRRVTDGWNISGIGTYQHGFPVSVTNNGFGDLQWSYPDAFFAPPSFADATGAPLQINHNPRNSATQQWVNPAAFTTPAAGIIGSANRDPFYGPGLNFWDLAVEKDVLLTETMKFEFRFETFNTFNHANFAAPVNAVGNPTFGTIDTVQGISTNGAGRVVQLAGKFYF